MMRKNADAISRLPLSVDNECAVVENNYLNVILDNGILVDHLAVKLETAKYIELTKVFTAIRTGNFSGLDKHHFQPYINRSSELTIEFVVVMWGYRMVIPNKLMHKLLHSVQASHFGIVKTKSLARSFMWWPSGIDSDIENLIKS